MRAAVFLALSDRIWIRRQMRASDSTVRYFEIERRGVISLAPSRSRLFAFGSSHSNPYQCLHRRSWNDCLTTVIIAVSPAIFMPRMPNLGAHAHRGAIDEIAASSQTD